MSDRFSWLEIDGVNPANKAPVAAPVIAPAPVKDDRRPSVAAMEDSQAAFDAAQAVPVVTPPAAPASPAAPVSSKAAYRALVGERKTTHGAVMSPRMHRFYRWCDDNGISLSDWSTDSQVLNVLPKLQAGLAQEQGALIMLPVGSPEGTIQAELIRDIEGMMQRVPANRSQGVVIQGALAGETKKSFKEGLIAVSQSSDVTGGVVYWQLTGEVNQQELVAALIEAGLTEDDAPALATPEVALGRAVKELQGRSVLIRKAKVAGGWAVVRESEVNGELGFQQIVRVYLEGDKNNEVVKFQATHGYEADAALEVERIIAEYNKARTALSVIDLSSWLTKTVSKLDGVPLRDRGGIYFIPRANIETLRKVKAALAAKSGCVVSEIPAMHSAEAISAIYDAVSNDSASFIADIEAELNAGIKPRAAKNRVEEVQVFLKKVRNYEGLLGQKFEKPAATLGKLVERLNKATTRAAQLEID